MGTAATPQHLGHDPAQVDAKHYKVEFENDRVRVLRIKYGPGEKSVMHGHPSGIAVFLTAGRANFGFPDGRSEQRSWKAGETQHLPAEQHLPENLSDRPLELVLIELKD